MALWALGAGLLAVPCLADPAAPAARTTPATRAGTPPQIEAQALFPDRALLRINGQDRLLRAGQRSPEGVLLRGADTAGADLEFAGRTFRIKPGGRAGGSFAPAPARQVWIARGADGMYGVDGQINGRAVRFMVDTGASNIAMNAAAAQALGVRFRNEGQAGAVQTASGIVKGYRVTLDEVRVGTLRAGQVEATVLDGPHPPQVLLGMSFLKRTRMRNEAGALVLESLTP